MYASRGKLFSHDELHNHLYGLTPCGGPNLEIIKVHLCKLRRKLIDHQLPLAISYSKNGRYAMTDVGASHDRRVA